MSDDELERLAAEMQNIKPSISAKQRAMNAAMTAFDAEFALEQANDTKEISTPAQGSVAAPRPTGQNTRTERVKIPRSGIMSKFKNSFSFNPKATMMLGSCAAALMFALVIMPGANYLPVVDKTDSKFMEVSEALSSDGSNEVGNDEIIVTGSRVGRSDLDSAAPQTVVSETESGTIAAIKDGVMKSDSDAQKLANAQREADFRKKRDQQVFNTGITVTPPPAPKIERSAPLQETGFDLGYSEPTSRDRFENYESNTVTSVKATPVSTFSIDVDTASYSYFRSSINRGQLPAPSSIRLEEMINYFPYDYAAPTSADEPFKANVTVTPTPWNADTKLMHIGIKGYVPSFDERPHSNIVLLIDTSGSMNQANKLPLLINSFKLLLGTLDEDDTVSIVTYAGSAGTVLEPTPASNKLKIKAALNQLRSGGSTAGAAGLELAYMKAQESFDEDGINRVILATDGDFNVGFSSPAEMKTFISKKRKTGIFLSVLGFGNGNYNDHLMQSLAQNGNGVAAYIDSLAEANKVLADEAGSALITIAKDVKIQVEFNPATISEYRLIGYETRALKREDFNNDKIDAGEINSGHSVTAIYELTPYGSAAQMVDDLRYADDAIEYASNDSEEFAFVKIRHKLPNSDTSTLQTFPVGPDQEQRLKRASDDMRFATAVAAVGQKLRGDTQLDDYNFQDAIKLASGARGDDENGYRAEFIQLVRLVDGLGE